MGGPKPQKQEDPLKIKNTNDYAKEMKHEPEN